MNQQNQYTAPAERALINASQYAKETGSPVVGTEHLLLGLAMETEGTAGVVLREYGVEERMLRNMISELIEPETESVKHTNRPGKEKRKKTIRRLELGHRVRKSLSFLQI